MERRKAFFVIVICCAVFTLGVVLYISLLEKPSEIVKYYIPYKIYVDFDRYSDGFRCAETMYRIAEEEGDQVWMANILNDIGELYRNKGEYSKALEEFLRLIDIFPNKLFEGRVLNTLSNRFIQIPDLKKNKELNQFLNQTIYFLKIISKFYEWDINKGDIGDFNEKREELLSFLRNELKEIKSLFLIKRIHNE